MKQLKQVSGFRSQGRVSERSTLEQSKDTCGVSSDSISLLLKNSSITGENRSAIKNRIQLSFRRNRELSNEETSRLSKKSIDEVSHSRVLSVEETTKLKSDIKDVIGTQNKISSFRHSIEKNSRCLFCLS